MALITNTAEAGVESGTAITATSQTGGTAGTAFDRMGSLHESNGGVTFDATNAAHGGLAYRLGFGSSSVRMRELSWLNRYSTRHALRWYNATSALPPVGSVGIAEVWYATQGKIVTLRRQADGSIQVLRGSGATETVAFTSAPLLANVVYRFEFRTKQATSIGATNGEEEFAIYLGDSPEPLPGCYHLATNVDNNVGRQVGATVRFAGSDSSNDSYYARLEWYDDIALATDDDATTLLGPVLPAPVSTARPYIVTDNAGGFIARGGAGLVAAVSDDVDETFVESPGANAGESITYALPPLTAGALRIVARAALGSAVTTMRVELLQGASTVIAERTFELTGAATDFELACTSTELASITDRSKLRVRVTGSPT